MAGDTLVRHFFRSFWYVFWQTKSIYGVLFGVVAAGGFVVGRVENLPFGDGFYFAMITGLTIGYGDTAPVTAEGMLVAIGLGVVGVNVTGMIVATAVHALRDAVEITRISEE